MPIRLKLAPEPFCDSRGAGDGPFAKSEAYRLLLSAVKSYSEGTIDGRAFLISGYRGAGKSTLASRAIEQAQQHFQSQNLLLRPVLIRLHGPDLLPPDDQGPDTETVLKQVTVAIWRAMADEFSKAYSAATVHAAPPSSRLATLNAPSRQLALLVRAQLRNVGLYAELAGQFRLELDGAPSASTLRDYWQRARALSSGVLFRNDNPAQAAAEIVALSSAAQAYRRVSGKESQSESQAANTTQKGNVGTKFDTKQILTPLLSLGSGAAIGLGADSSFGPLAGAIAGSAAAILSAFALEFSWTRERTVKQEITFLADTTVASLDRMLPTLVQRIRATGLAPIFVIDELDKVERLFDRMRKLVKHLKHFMTERAFFCFITDRRYFEQLNTIWETGTYPEEYTYFSERLFITYDAASLHLFLSGALTIDEADKATKQSLAIDRDILRFVLLFRSRMHMLDLSRRLTMRFASDATLDIAPEMLQRRVYGFQVCMQLAVEYLLRQGALADRLAQDPDFRQIACDALYYPAQSWENGDLELNLSVDRFSEDLNSRTGKSDFFNGREVHFLHNLVLRLANLVCDPQKLRELLADIEGTPRWPDLPEAVIAAIPGTPLLRPKAQDLFEWRYTLHGLPVEDPQIDTILNEDLERNLTLIESVRDLLKDGNLPDLQSLSVAFRVLSTSPSWSETEPALRLLRQAQQDRIQYPDMSSNAEIVNEYAEMLRRSSGRLALVIRAAANLSTHVASDSAEDRVKQAFTTVTNLLQLGNLNEMSMSALFDQVLPDKEAEFNLPALGFESWKKKLGMPLPARNEEGATAALTGYHKQWLERFKDFLAGTAVKPVNVTDLAGAVQRPALASFFAEPKSMSLQNWTNIFIECVVNPTSAPTSFVPVALRVLGFSARMKQITDAIPDFEGNLTVWSNLLGAAFIPEPDGERNGRALVIRITEVLPPWPVSARFAALVATRERLEMLLSRCPQLTQQVFGIGRLFIEVDAKRGADTLDQTLDATTLMTGFPKLFDSVGRTPFRLIGGAEGASRAAVEATIARGLVVTGITFAKDLDAAMESSEPR